MQPLNPSKNPTTYFVNPEESDELTRLLNVEQVVTKEMGGVFPSGYQLPSGSYVLDLACGPGGWACEVAQHYPDSDVVGLDISQKMIRYARAHAKARKLENASFQVASLLEPLQFPNDAFDFVNARLLSSFMPITAWPHFLHECTRITRPGGTLRITDAEWQMTNGAASEQFAALVTRAMWLDGKSFAPDGRRFGITLHLNHFLRSIPTLTQLQHHSYCIEFSYGTPYHDVCSQSLTQMYPRMAPFLLKTGVTSQEEIDRLCSQIANEMQEPDFRAAFSFLSSWGIKRHTNDATA